MHLPVIARSWPVVVVNMHSILPSLCGYFCSCKDTFCVVCGSRSTNQGFCLFPNNRNGFPHFHIDDCSLQPWCCHLDFFAGTILWSLRSTGRPPRLLYLQMDWIIWFRLTVTVAVCLVHIACHWTKMQAFFVCESGGIDVVCDSLKDLVTNVYQQAKPRWCVAKDIYYRRQA